MREYPKIETIWNRDERTKKVIPGAWRLPEFAAVSCWTATEKIDGTNIRIGLNADGGLVIGGRTDRAQVPTSLLAYLMATFQPERLREKFGDAEFVLFGEGYGPKIQVGEAYSKAPQFRLFDVLVGEWWLEPENITDVASFFGINTVPMLGLCDMPRSIDELATIIQTSFVAQQDGGTGCRAEGIVARSSPLLLTRRGDRVMWKLKFRDF